MSLLSTVIKVPIPIQRRDSIILKRKSIRPSLSLACFCLLGMTLIAGCEKKAEEVASAQGASAPAAASPADDARAQQFLTQLEAQPENKRKEFVESHKEESKLAAQSHDPAINQKFYQLMMPKMVMPGSPQ